jgi:hypothetical protein
MARARFEVALAVVLAALAAGALGAAPGTRPRIAARDLRPALAAPGWPGAQGDAPGARGPTAAAGRGGGGGDAPAPAARRAHAAPPRLRAVAARHDILVWSMRLDASECTSGAASPCYNIYAINGTSGELLWYAYRCAGAHAAAGMAGERATRRAGTGACRGSGAPGGGATQSPPASTPHVPPTPPPHLPYARPTQH